MAYESKQAILEEAGLIHVVNNEDSTRGLTGAINGSNKVFTVSQIPIADADYSDAVEVTDVVVFVNSAAATVTAVNAATGQITLQTAPPSNATVTVNYRYSSISDETAERVREEAEGMVDERLDILTTSNRQLQRPATSRTIRKVVRFYAAGLLLARDYGFQNDTANTSKDGYKKMDMAENWLTAYEQLLESQDVRDDPLETPGVDADPALFPTYDPVTGKYVDGANLANINRDTNFMTGIPDEDGRW